MLISSHKSGFTLIELSIVIVIIGLIVAGVVGGKSLVESANLKRVIAETQRFKQAYNTFKLTYNYMPGDIPNATSYWSGSADGNGDRYITWSAESLRGHEQLGLSGLWPGTYSTTKFIHSVYKNGSYHTPIQCSSMGRSDMGRNCAQLGTESDWNASIFTPRQLHNIDSALDDGMPLTGKIRFRAFGAVTTST